MGGKAFDNVVSIYQRDIPDTIKDFEYTILNNFGKLKRGIDWDLVGSALKKTNPSGDLDIIINQKLLKTKGELVLDYLANIVKTFSLDYKIFKGLGVVSIAFPIHGSKNKVQIDLMPTDNLEFTRWSYFSPYENETKFKEKMGTYRTEYLKAIAAECQKKIIDKFPTGEPKIIKRFTLSSDIGLSRKIFSYIGKKGNMIKNPIEIEKKLVSKDPDKIIKILLGPEATILNTNSFETIYKKMTSFDFPYKNKIPAIKKNLIDRYKERGMNIPKELSY
jgi:hypothetical protein